MKYGETLQQRSIPEWSHYNIDYDYLKDLIKHHTTPGAGAALSIPGQGASTERAFSETFFNVLKAQHGRINLFIKSKSGEVERRLDYIGKQLGHLQARQSLTASGSLPARTVEKYAKIEADAIRAGEEMRALSRFRIAQRVGFHKIVKKYKRWTKDRALEQRFKQDVIGRPDSFYQLDLGYLLDRYVDILGALRAILEDTSISGPSSSPQQPSSASRISKAVEDGSPIDLDIALNTVPLGAHGRRATYWVHTDHIVEVAVLLLQHMRLHAKPNSSPTMSKDLPHGTLRANQPSTAARYLSTGDDVGLVILDDPSKFAQKQNAGTVGASETGPGAIPTKAAGLARWTAPGAAAVAVGLDSSRSDEQYRGSDMVIKMKQKNLGIILDRTSLLDRELHDAPSAPLDPGENPAEGSHTVEKWLAKHPDSKPIACICSKRTRFLGPHNTPDGGTWATLDRDVCMNTSLPHELYTNESNADKGSGSHPFPHAVLEIRREGAQSAGLIHMLDRSHLVERVRGFSLEAQAVWWCCRPCNMSPPSWISLLDRDIRKLPAPIQRQRRTATSTTDGESHPTSRASTSATSVASPYHTGETSASDFIEPPPLRAFRKKRRNFAEHSTPEELIAPRTEGYWNEYDNPESDEEGYYIYLDPNASNKLPGQETLENWVSKTRYLLGLGKTDEESPLLSAAEDVSSDDDSNESLSGPRGGYGTMGGGTHQRSNQGYFSRLWRFLGDDYDDAEATHWRSDRERQRLLGDAQTVREREMARFQLYASCLGAAVVLDIMLGVLTTTSRRRLRGEVDGAVIFGVCCNLLLLLVAITSLMSRRDRLGWLHQGVVYIIAMAMIAADVVLLVWAVSS